MSAVGAALRETRDSIGSVFHNPGLRRIQLALAGSMIGDWAYATAATVWAYSVGGATAVGIWTAVRLTLMATTAPVLSVLADRYPRKQVMIGADLVRVVLVALAALCLYVDTPAAFIFVLATLASLMGTPFRASQRALTPALAERPEELTAANGTGSTIESLSFFIGPAIGATLIGLTDVATVFVLNALTFLWSMAMVVGIKIPDRPEERRAAEPEEPEQPADKPSFLAETAAGFTTIFRNRDLAVTVGEVAAQTIIAGASAVFGVVIAVDILGSGAKGVGYLDAMLGVGAVIGGLLAISRAGKRKLGQDMTIGVILWSLPLLFVTIAPHPVAAFAAMALLGLANPLVDVNMDTIVQRITPPEVMGRVFGALETCLIGTMALGSIAMPVLLHLVGLRTSLAILGVLVALLAVAGLPQMRSMDRRLGVPDGLPLLQAIPIFAPLTPATVETLARALVRVEIPAGQEVLHEGDDSDRFYVIESGHVRVTQQSAAGDRVLREEGPGEFFGEIGLLRDVPRTATITALDDLVLQTLDRASFVDAVTGQSDSALVADDIVSRRLAY